MDERRKAGIKQDIQLLPMLADIGRGISNRLSSVPAEELPSEMVELLAQLAKEDRQARACDR